MKPSDSPFLRLGVLSLSLAACAATPDEAPAPPAPTHATLLASEIRLPRSPLLDEIAEIEEQRAWAPGAEARLIALLGNEDTLVRRRAVIALGRLPYPRIGATTTDALCALLDDPDVRIAAAFALGIRNDPSAAGVLVAYLYDADPMMRARVVEAAGRLDDGRIQQDLLVALRDADLGVKIEAAVASAHWSTDEPNAADVDRALLDTLRPYRIERSDVPTTRTAIEAGLVWRILFALSRRGSPLGRGAFLEYGYSDVPLEQLYAVRGLARLEADAELVECAANALGSSDWRIAYEAAVALGHFGDAASLAALASTDGNGNEHVRAGILVALGNFPQSGEITLPILRRGLADIAVPIHNAALLGIVRIVPVEDAIQMLQRFIGNDDPLVRLGVAHAAAQINSPEATALLRILADDPSLLVATRAVENMGTYFQPEVRLVLHEILNHADNGMRLAAITALRESPDDSDAPYLMQAFQSSDGDVSTEVAFNVIESLGRTPNAPGASDFVRAALVDTRPHVRRVALRVLKNAFEIELTVNQVPPPQTQRHAPLPGEDFPAWTRNPMVQMTTTRGEMVFELFPAETPKHVVSFLQLIDQGAYNGLSFHRVVSDFVVQGGDYRGDGNGARTPTGQALRHEFGPRKYVRGSLGMPRNEDVDSGGSQFFITHRPTPHLDGRYTIFGELRTGGSVLDSLQLGDRILRIRLLPAR